MRKLVVGILAHVDAGKTTLSEALLYQSGALRRLGRVDHQDAFLDTDAMERERGITIFSKQAVFSLKDTEVTLLDTPGHVDFSAEAERTLQVLDCAILVISGTDGVQAHTRTLWRLLERYHVPTFLFVNKMDLAGADRAAVLAGLKQHLGSGCVDFSGERDESFREEAAVCDESVLERYLETGVLTDGDLRRMVGKRKLFPCWFGSALKLEGVSEFLEGVEQYAHTALGNLRQLEEEDPQLHIAWNEQTRQIHVQLMGEIQLEILQRMIRERFGLEVAFGPGAICYRETIAAPVEGIGHFEPLRHYAEVHLLLEPGERGSGLEFGTACPEDQLEGRWQRLVLTHLAEKEHLGVLTAREAHGGRRLPPGHLSGGAPGADGGGEHPAGALVRLPPGAARPSGGPGHDGPPADGGAAVSAGDGGGGGCAHWCRGGVRSGGLRPGGGRLHPGPGAAALFPPGLCALCGPGRCAGVRRLRPDGGFGQLPGLRVLQPRRRRHRPLG